MMSKAVNLARASRAWAECVSKGMPPETEVARWAALAVTECLMCESAWDESTALYHARAARACAEEAARRAG